MQDSNVDTCKQKRKNTKHQQQDHVGINLGCSMYPQNFFAEKKKKKRMKRMLLLSERHYIASFQTQPAKKFFEFANVG